MERGTHLGEYRIEGPLGAGGMGEVYRARDTTLDREVAVKLLPSEYGQGMLGRFEREAKVLAGLNHPNICTIHGIGDADGTPYIVMELVQGETLAERLRGGGLPVREALEIARQLAEALEAAHEQGIVHRDLKPANVMLGPRGRVKVLDFGLAKPTQLGAGTSPAEAATQVTALSEPGAVVGTWPYMSPEQVRGQEVDPRTDIWAFGCLLYEMLAGRRAFWRETAADTLSAVLEAEPDWRQLPPDTPRSTHRMLRRCLVKDPDRRLRDVADARFEIEDVLGMSGEVPPELLGDLPAEQPAPRWRAALPWAVAALMAAAAVAAFWSGQSGRASAPRQRAHLEMKLGRGPLLYTPGAGVVISPDAGSIAYVVGGGPATQGLYLRFLDRLESERLVEGPARYPFFSPDGQWIGYEVGGTVWAIPLTGGTSRLLLNGVESPMFSVAWDTQDTIVYTSELDDSAVLFSVPERGGDAVQLTEIAGDEKHHMWPQLLPGGRALVFTTRTGGLQSEASVEVLDLATGERVFTHPGGAYGRYVASGHITYLEEGSLFAVPFDLDPLEVAGPPALVVQQVGVGSAQGNMIDGLDRRPPYSVADNGTLLYLRDPGRSSTLTRVNRFGGTSLVWDLEGGFGVWPVMSPDGRKLALARQDAMAGAMDVHVYDLERDVPTRVTFTDTDGPSVPVAWSPDGDELFFWHRPTDVRGLYRTRADGTGTAERLWEGVDASITGDGRTMAFTKHGAAPGGSWDIWTTRVDGAGEPEPVAASAATELHPRISPDGRWIAYTSDESGSFEVYVNGFPPGRAGRQRVSSAGGGQPQWSADGRELYYRTGSGVMVVDVQNEAGEARFSRPSLLFDGSFSGNAMGINGSLPDFAAAPDGQSFFLLVERERDDAASPHVALILDWFDELRRLAPPAR